MGLLIRTCILFQETMEKYANYPAVREKLANFILTKTENPQMRFGAKDYPFTNEGNLKGYHHAGITKDISIVYKLGGQGANKTLDLYGLFSHHELGTGQPGNPKKVQANAKRFNNQLLK